MVLLKLKNLDGVALCLLCLLVCDFCLTIMIRGFATCYLFSFFFWFLCVMYVRSPSPSYIFFYSFPFLFTLIPNFRSFLIIWFVGGNIRKIIRYMDSVDSKNRQFFSFTIL